MFFKCFYLRRSIFKGKRLSIFDVKAFADEAPKPGLLRTRLLKWRSILTLKDGIGVFIVTVGYLHLHISSCHWPRILPMNKTIDTANLDHASPLKYCLL